MSSEKSAVRVEIGGEWKLKDLNAFARNYEDLHAFIFHFRAALETDELSEIRKLFARVPKSRFNASNFFAQLRSRVPEDLQPLVRAIEYGSPGFIDLQHAANIAQIVGTLVTFYLAARGLCMLTFEIRPTSTSS